MKTIKPFKICHSGKKRSYPAAYLWQCPCCPNCGNWKTKNTFGTQVVQCSQCLSKFILDKTLPENA